VRGRLSAACTAAAGTLLAVLAGCGEPPVSPLPTQAPAASGAAPGAPPGPAPAPSGNAPPATVPTQVTATATGRVAPAPIATRQPTTRPPTTAPPTSTPTTPPTSATPSLPSDCLGAVPYDVDAAAPEAPARSLCFHPGATLRVSNAGPDEVTAEPADLVTRADEDGLTTVTFTGTGDVTVTVGWQGEPYVIAVEVRPSPSDPD
jgi:hypothetical protein